MSGRSRRSRLVVLLVLTAVLLSVPSPAPVGAADGPMISGVEFSDEVRTGGEQVVTFAISGAGPSNITVVGVRWDTVSHSGGGLSKDPYRFTVTVNPTEDGDYVVSFGAPLEEGKVYFVVHSEIDGVDHFGDDREFSFDVAQPPALELGMGFLMALLVVIVLAGLAMFALWLRSRRGWEKKR